MIYFMGMFIPNIFLGVFLEDLCVLEVIIGKNNFPLKRAHFFFKPESTLTSIIDLVRLNIRDFILCIC